MAEPDITDPDVQALAPDLQRDLGAPGSPTPAAHGDEITDPDVLALQQELLGGNHKAAPRHAPASAAPVAAATRFQAAAQPTQGPEPSWGDVGSEALHNLGPSALGTVTALGHAIAHPVQTVQTLGKVAQGVGSQAAGALGFQQDPAQKTRTEALAQALEHHYAQAYGSIPGFKKALATDPVGVGLDASTLLGGAGVGAKVAGLPKIAGALEALDPVNAALNVTKRAGAAATYVPAKIARVASSVQTGVPHSLMEVATKAGATDDPVLRQAFLKYYKGQGDPESFLQTAQNAVGQVRQDASDAYLQGKGSLADVQPSFKPVDDALANARNDTMRGGVNAGQFKAANAALDEAEAMIGAWKGSPDLTSLQGFDNLKQAVWDLRDNTGNAAAKRHLGGVYNGVKQALVDADPAYAELMEQYQTALANLTDLQKTLVGAGRNPAASMSMAKSLRALKTPSGDNLFQQLATKQPTLPYMLAGHALSPWTPGGTRTALEMLATPLWFGAHAPIGIPAQLLSASPKISGALNYGAGALPRLAGAAKPYAGAAYYAGQADQEAAAHPAPEGDQAPQIEDQTGRDTVWSHMLKQESGNTQFGKDGKVKESPKGAVGAAQVMPQTGPVAAKLAGVPWDPVRFRYDASYNRQLGRAYFDAQVDRFGLHGGAAAYNAGPGAVHHALQQAQARGGEWTDYLPDETRAYVPAVSEGSAYGGRIRRKSGGRVDEKRAGEIAERLIRLTKQAKKAEAKRTEPLLNASDDMIARALQVAGRA